MRTTIGPYRCLLAVSVLGGALGMRALARGAPDIVWMRAGTRVGCIPSPLLPDGALFAYGRRDATVVVARNPFHMSVCDPCDANCDGLLDQFDIETFIACLFGP